MPDWEGASWVESSTARVLPPARPRKLAKVPFVELADGRLQGVVSSGSDIERVDVSSIAASADHSFACSTNNNRPCGGARGNLCNHLRALVTEAVTQYGGERVARFMKLDLAEPDDSSIIDGLLAVGLVQGGGAQGDAVHVGAGAAAPVFSRFLRHLAYLELAPSTAPVPEMQWFPAAGTAA